MDRKSLSKRLRIALYALCAVAIFIMAGAEFVAKNHPAFLASMGVGLEGISIVLKKLKKSRYASALDALAVILFLAAGYLYYPLKTFITYCHV